jgi:hypothetical protein
MTYPSRKQCVTVQNAETLVIVESLARFLTLDSRNGVLKHQVSVLLMKTERSLNNVLA